MFSYWKTFRCIAFNYMLIALFSKDAVFRLEASKNCWVFIPASMQIVVSHVINISLLEGKKRAGAAEVSRLLLLAFAGFCLRFVYD